MEQNRYIRLANGGIKIVGRKKMPTTTPKPTLCCPKCDSENILARVLMCGFGVADVNNLSVDEEPEGCDYDPRDMDEAYCATCDYEFDIVVTWVDELDAWVFRVREERT